MKKVFTNKKITTMNLLVVFYFSMLYVLHVQKLDAVLIGVFRELFTIPMLIGMLFLTFNSFVSFFNFREKNWLHLLSCVALVLCALVTLGSFFN